MSVMLNLAGIIVGNQVNGPGRRIVLWVQGCTIGCPGCCNPELQPHEQNKLVEPVKLADELKKALNQTGCEGVTISGGEPLQQAPALAMLTENLRKANVGMVCYSGYSKGTIMASDDPNIRKVLSNIDMLIAGPYQKDVVVVRNWHNDPDKEIVFLSERYSLDDLQGGHQEEIVIDLQGSFISGFMDSEEKDKWHKMLLNE